jgi:hypothetical protein
MNRKIVSFLMLILVGACTHRHSVSDAPDALEKPKKISYVKPTSLKTKSKDSIESGKTKTPKTRTRVFWRLIGEQDLVIKLRELDGKKLVRSFTLEPGFTVHDIIPGSWEVIGLSFNEESFDASEIAEKIILRTPKNRTSYAGALLLDCPKVGEAFLEELKTMKFFNRYTFNSLAHTCEMVVGNDFSSVVEEWKNREESKGSKLELGL